MRQGLASGVGRFRLDAGTEPETNTLLRLRAKGRPVVAALRRREAQDFLLIRVWLRSAML